MEDYYCVEIDLKPIDRTYGLLFDGGSYANLQWDVPWSYKRNQVPDVLARQGVALDSWQQAVDSADSLCKDRNAALGRENLKNNRRWWKMGGVLGIIGFILFVVMAAHDDSSLLLRLVVFCYFFFLLPFLLCLPVLNRSKHLELISEFEEHWSHRVRDLNATTGGFQQHGITVEKYRRKFLIHGQKVAWSVGLVFSFKMQPSGEEEVAWCVAHSQSSGVSEASVELRSLRVIKEQPWRLEAETVGATALPGGGEVDMAVAVALDDEDDAGHARNTEKVSEKSTLLDLV